MFEKQPNTVNNNSLTYNSSMFRDKHLRLVNGRAILITLHISSQIN